MLFLSLFFVCVFPSPTPSPTPSSCASQLTFSILSILKNPLYRTSTWGMTIAARNLSTTNDSPYTLFSLLSQNFRIPASNNKLLTTSALYFTDANVIQV
jgi:hypothetical protein